MAVAVGKVAGVLYGNMRKIAGVSHEPLLDLFAGDSSLLAYYRFDAGLLTKDLSGNGKTLVNSNSVVETTSGKIGGGADFGSTQQHNKGLASYGISLPGDFSFAFWLKLTTEVSGAGYYFDLIDTMTNGYIPVTLQYSYNSGNRQLYLAAGDRKSVV